MATPAEAVRAHFHARASRDVDGAVAMFAPDVVLHLPDVVPFADQRGTERLIAVLEVALQSTDGTYAADLIDVVGGGNVAVAVVAVTATRDGAPVAYHQAWTYRFERDVVVEAWLHMDIPEVQFAALYGAGSDDVEGAGAGAA
ncbi:MAG: nuclear transport factor 2 family protein [Acidimicrobiia bacterium]